MSVAALNKVLNQIKNTEAKNFRLKRLNNQVTSLIINRAETVEAIAYAVGKEYLLTPEEVKGVESRIDKLWPQIEAAFSTISSKAGQEVIKKPNEIIIIQSGNKDNYDTISGAINKKTGRFYPAFWGLILPKIRGYLIFLRKTIKTKEEFKLVDGKRKYTGKQIDNLTPGALINLGHYQGSNIQYAAAAAFRDNITPETLEDITKVMRSSTFGMSEYNTNIDLLTELSSKFNTLPVKGDFKKTVTVRFEYGVENQLKGTNEEKRLRADIEGYIRGVIKNANDVDWLNQEASDSPLQATTKIVIAAAIAAGGKTLANYKLNTNPSKTSDREKIAIKNKKARMRLKYTGSGGKESSAPMAVPSYLSMIALLNARLPPKVRSNMGSPRLNNQSGQFSESAQVTNILTTPQGFASIEYTYQRSPYDVFDKTRGKAPWNTPARDPSALVGLSVRQLATEMGMRRFYTRRAA